MLDFGFYCMDCMDGMKEFPDKYFDLAIVDPPYGIHVSASMGKQARYGEVVKHKKATWDSRPPDKKYFRELMRVSKNQIIFGANHFISLIAIDSPCWIVWDKQFSSDVSFASAELAWTSFTSVTKKVSISPLDEKGGHLRIHPTQKPVALYKWILSRYANYGDKILDTHVGSASSLIACRETGHKYVGFEIDKEYYEKAKQRLDYAEAQQNIFDYLRD